MKINTPKGANYLKAAVVAGMFLWGMPQNYAQETGLTVSKESKETQAEQEEEPKEITVFIVNNTVTVNGKVSSVRKFTSSVDAATADWTEEEIKASVLKVSKKNADKKFVKALNGAYLRTRAYKLKPENSILPSSSKVASKPSNNMVDSAQNAEGAASERPKINLSELAEDGAEFYFDGQKVPLRKAEAALYEVKGIKAKTLEKEDGSKVVYLTSPQKG